MGREEVLASIAENSKIIPEDEQWKFHDILENDGVPAAEKMLVERVVKARADNEKDSKSGITGAEEAGIYRMLADAPP